MNICVIGLGRLGAPFAACWLKRGFKVIGVDKNENITTSLKNKIAPSPEPGFQEILNEYGHNLELADIQTGVNQADFTFIIVSTPSRSDGTFSDANVLAVANLVGEALRDKPHHTVVVASTVSPGAIDQAIIPALEKASGKRCDVDFDVCYVPEWVALGELIKGFLNPDITIIGRSTPRAGTAIRNLYSQFLENSPTIIEMSRISAEISKVCLNAYIAAKITFANVIAGICEQIPGANAEEVTSAIGLDSRIGKKYFKGGMSYGGPCFPRDVHAFRSLAYTTNNPTLFPEAIDYFNKHRITILRDLILRTTEPGFSVGIMGMAFKPNTNVTEDSPSLWLWEEIKSLRTYQLYDKEVTSMNGIHVCQDLNRVISNCDTLVFMNPCMEFKNIDTSLFENKVVIDCWNILPKGNYNHITLGKHNENFM